MNDVILIGKYCAIKKISNDIFVITIILNNKQDNIKLLIYLDHFIADNIIKFCHKDDLLSIRAFISFYNNKLCIIAYKISFVYK